MMNVIIDDRRQHYLPKKYGTIILLEGIALYFLCRKIDALSHEVEELKNSKE